MSNLQQHDVDGGDMKDIEELLERDKKLANLETHPRPPSELVACWPHEPLFSMDLDD